MRVKVTHTLQLEATPAFAEQLLQAANRRLNKASEELAYVLRSAQDILFLAEKLGDIKEQLSLAETQIQDGLNIMIGHHNALANIEQEQEEEQLEDPPEAAVDE